MSLNRQLLSLHIAAVLAANVVQCARNLAQRIGFDGFHEFGEHVAALPGNGLESRTNASPAASACVA